MYAVSLSLQLDRVDIDFHVHLLFLLYIGRMSPYVHKVQALLFAIGPYIRHSYTAPSLHRVFVPSPV